MNSLKTILYFSIFNFPITIEEILMYSHCQSLEDAQDELNALVEENVVYKFDNYFLKTNNPEFIEKRLKGNEMAQSVMPKAMQMAEKISKFPYVRGVAFSGAFSKGYFDENGDIDFFIITTNNRLWIARTFLIVYKKLFLLNSKKYFCVNYFISENRLNISEKNKFTAMETATLIPTHGKNVFTDFYEQNEWVSTYFPNIDLTKKLSNTQFINPTFFRRSIEYMLDSNFGAYVDTMFHKFTLNKWRRKFGYLTKEDFSVAMKSTQDVSKHHPMNYQKKVIETLNEKYSQIDQTYNIKLEPEHA